MAALTTEELYEILRKAALGTGTKAKVKSKSKSKSSKPSSDGWKLPKHWKISSDRRKLWMEHNPPKFLRMLIEVLQCKNCGQQYTFNTKLALVYRIQDHCIIDEVQLYPDEWEVSITLKELGDYPNIKVSKHILGREIEECPLDKFLTKIS